MFPTPTQCKTQVVVSVRARLVVMVNLELTVCLLRHHLLVWVDLYLKVLALRRDLMFRECLTHTLVVLRDLLVVLSCLLLECTLFVPMDESLMMRDTQCLLDSILLLEWSLSREPRVKVKVELKLLLPTTPTLTAMITKSLALPEDCVEEDDRNHC